MQASRMPILFVGHGSPMNAISDNVYTKKWEEIAKDIPIPKAILVISAHWTTLKVSVNNIKNPPMIYDMYGFDQALYELKYPVQGSPDLAKQVIELMNEKCSIDNSWGIDHGAWSVLCKMYPMANIPVVQLSVGLDYSFEDYFEMGNQLSSLRDHGILIVASGNIVHNLRRIEWDNPKGAAFAQGFDTYIKKAIQTKEYQKVIEASKHPDFYLAVPSKEHFVPILYILGALSSKDKLEVFNDDCILGSLSMTGYFFKEL